LILFVGQVEREHRHMGAFQEVDYERVFGSMVKWVVEVDHAERLPDLVATAFHAAQSGTPGPVVIALPEDMLEDRVDRAPAKPLPLPVAGPPQDMLLDVAARIAEARKPLIIAGGLLKNPQGQAALRDLAEAFGIPVATAVRHADLLPNIHPLYAGHLAYGAPKELAAAVGQADLVIAVGTRLGDVTTQGFQFPAAPKPLQPLIHVWPDATAVGRIRHVDLGLVCDPASFLKGLRIHAPNHIPDHRIEWSRHLHAVATGLRHRSGPMDADDGVVFAAAVQAADRVLANNAIITIDSGNFGGWVQRLMRFGGGRTMLAPSSGAMGYGVPAAVSASLRCPEREVVCFVGDGGFLMTGSELATAMQSGARPILVIADNGSYGTIRMHQEKQFPTRISATALVNPNFPRLAETYGALGILVEHSNQAEDAFKEALASKRPAVISVRTSLEHISAGATIAQLREHSS
jgi:acetolactate synthase-1/2/3 large subunit